ncbi:hypothetical protein BGX29_008050 [Mortierella sp. GBA35]|nr:hypothetical protein BGX29_008050 [Mortierella sp. GBA35]
MSQPSKPATAYFKAAVKVLRLQRTLSRSKSSKSKNSASPTNSIPCSPSTPTFQHCNGRRVSYNQFLQYQHHQQQHNQGHHYKHHYRSESFDTPLYTLQRRCHTTTTTTATATTATTSSTGQHHIACSPASISHKHPCKEVIIYSPALPSSAAPKHSRRSGSLATFPVFSIHRSQQPTASSSSLSRSKSLPNRRWNRVSHQVVVVPQHLDIWVAGLVPAPYETSIYQQPHKQQQEPRRQSLSIRSRASTMTMSSPPPTPSPQPLKQDETAMSDTCCEGGVKEDEVFLDRDFEHILNPTNIDMTALQRSNAVKASLSSSSLHGGSSSRKTIAPGCSRPSRSLTSSSLSSSTSTTTTSSVFSTAMPLADSSMSIQSQRSESSLLPSSLSSSSSSLLSAVISAGGGGLFPSMDEMMDQVDRSIAADSQAQLVENAHVGLVACVSVVDRNLLAEPCSAEIETWVS